MNLQTSEFEKNFAVMNSSISTLVLSTFEQINVEFGKAAKQIEELKTENKRLKEKYEPEKKD